jgi:hypothetical protein
MKDEKRGARQRSNKMSPQKNGGNIILGYACLDHKNKNEGKRALLGFSGGSLFDKSDLCNGILWIVYRMLKRKNKE